MADSRNNLTDYGPLFAQPKVELPSRVNNPEKRNLRQETEEWIRSNPRIAELFLRFARQMALRGKHFGVKALAERVRWECSYEYGEGYKLNNNYPAYIARWLIQQDPALEPFIEFREVHW